MLYALGMGLFASMFPGITGFNPAFEKPMMGMFMAAPPNIQQSMMKQFGGMKGVSGPFEKVMGGAFHNAPPEVQAWSREYARSNHLDWLSHMLGGPAPAMKSRGMAAPAAAARAGGGRGFNLFSITNKGRDSVAGFQGPFSQALGNMLADAPPSVQKAVRIGSGFRSNEHQAQLFQNAVRKYGSVAAARKWVAPPGHSQHNKGNAADLEFLTPEAKAWVHANAERYGLAFPMGYEPWHIEIATARGGGAVKGGPMKQAMPAGYGPGGGFGGGYQAPPTIVPATSEPGAGLSSPMVPAVPTSINPTSPTVGAGLFAGLGGGGGGEVLGLGPKADIGGPSGPLEAALAAGQANQEARAAMEGLVPVADQTVTSGKPMSEVFGTPGFDQPEAAGGLMSRLFGGAKLADLGGGIRYRA